MGKALTWRTLACTLLPMLAAAGGAQAQSYGYGYDDDRYGGREGSGIVRCESIKNRSNECRLEGRARMIRQLSGSPCVEGETWGQSRYGVWVTQGCRAEFVGEYRRGGGWGNGGGLGQRQRQRQRLGRRRGDHLSFQWASPGVLRRPHPPRRAPGSPGFAQCLHRGPDLGLGSSWHLGQRRLPGTVPGELSVPL